MLQPTDKQREALGLLKSDARNVMLYGGTRSGKTVVLLEAEKYRALKYPKSRHLAARLRFAHAKTSLWHETLLPSLKDLPRDSYKVNHSDYYVSFENGSEIWVGGFDDAERIEKILGHEYATIFINECSQIGYDTVVTAQSRLAQKIEGLTNKMYFDCNPPSPSHWTYKRFILKQDPKTSEKLLRPDLDACMRINPVDNLANLPADYIQTQLDTLPEKARQRFRDGLFVNPAGAIYDHFDDSMIVEAAQVPQIEEYTVGVDFGLNMAAVLIGWCGDSIYILADYGAYCSTTSSFNSAITAAWKEKISQAPAYCDPSGGERLTEIARSHKANNDVEAGLNSINTKMEHKQFFVCRTCTGVLGEIYEYKRDETGKVIKENDHYMDAMRYGVYSRIARPRIQFV